MDIWFFFSFFFFLYSSLMHVNSWRWKVKQRNSASWIAFPQAKVVANPNLSPLGNIHSLERENVCREKKKFKQYKREGNGLCFRMNILTSPYCATLKNSHSNPFWGYVCHEVQMRIIKASHSRGGGRVDGRMNLQLETSAVS